MASYSLIITKKKLQISLTTSDSEFVAQQFENWINNASDYAHKYKAQQCKNIVAEKIQAEEAITNQNIEKEIKRKQDTSVEPIKTEEPQKKEKEKALDIFYTPETINKQQTYNEMASDKTEQEGIFDAILENSIENPKTELSFKPTPSLKKDEAYLSFMSGKNIEKKIDYLLLTSYYLTQYEQRPRFTLKQLNAKLMQNLACIIDHSVLQEAINRNYIECLPDLTGIVGTSEYRLTAYGEKVLLDE